MCGVATHLFVPSPFSHPRPLSPSFSLSILPTHLTKHPRSFASPASVEPQRLKSTRRQVSSTSDRFLTVFMANVSKQYMYLQCMRQLRERYQIRSIPFAPDNFLGVQHLRNRSLADTRRSTVPAPLCGSGPLPDPPLPTVSVAVRAAMGVRGAHAAVALVLWTTSSVVYSASRHLG